MTQGDLFDRTEPPPPPTGVPPEVVSLFEKLSLDIASRGWQRYSARAVLHRIRWHFRIEKGDREFKANNNWTPALSRWFLNKHPELPDFFELRALGHEREDAA